MTSFFPPQSGICCCVGPGGRSGRDHEFHAKPRRSDKRRTIFRHSPRAAPVGAFLDKGHPGRKPSSARRARQALVPGVPGGWLSLMCQLLARGVFRALDFGGIRISLLLIVDNYNQAAKSNHKGTKAQRTPKEIRGSSPAYRSLRAMGHPRPAAPRPWTKLSGPAVLSSGYSCPANALGYRQEWPGDHL